MKKIFLLSVILMISYSCKNRDNKLVIQEFIDAVISDSYDGDKIKKEFIHFYNEYHESKDILFDLQIIEFRSSLKKCNSITIIEYDEAKKHFESAHSYLDIYMGETPDKRAFINLSPARQNMITDKYADLLSWDGDVLEKIGQYNEAAKFYAKAQEKYNELANYSVLPSNNSSKQVDWNARYSSVSLDYAQARMKFMLHNYSEALAIIERAELDMEEILVQDEGNISWQAAHAKITESKKGLLNRINERKN